MKKIAFLFPGQGAQKVGMADDFDQFDSYYDRADRTLPFSLRQLMTEGPQERLTMTYYAQPSLLTVGAYIAERLKRDGIIPDIVAGHSLGEYTALVAADVLSYEQAVQTVYERGLHMNEAVPVGQGAMAAVIGGDRAMIERVTEKVTAAGDLVQLANINAPGQIVISGTVQGIEQATPLLKEEGVRRVILLDVSGPFHSKLMIEGAEKLQQTFEKMTWQDAKVPIVTNVDATIETDRLAIQQSLIRQLYSPVEWVQSMERLVEEGVTDVIECGPGRVLKGLMRKIDRSVTVHTIEDETSYKAVVEKIKEVLK